MELAVESGTLKRYNGWIENAMALPCPGVAHKGGRWLAAPWANKYHGK